MPREINFLAERRKGISKTQARDRQWFKWSSWGLGVVGVVGVVLLISWAFLNYQFNQIKKQQDAVLVQISRNQENEAALVVYIRKLATLTQVYRDRQDKNNVIAYFSTILGSKATIVGIKFDPAPKLLQFQVQSDNIFSLRQVLDILNGTDIKAKYPAVSFSHLTRDDSAKYNLMVSVPM
jgi:hypothetical protein